MTYACPAWEFAADTHLLKLQWLQNKVLRTIGNFPRRTPVCELHLALKLLYVYVVCPKSMCTDVLFKCVIDSPEIISYLLQSTTIGNLHSG
jgi:hypothetical protein